MVIISRYRIVKLYKNGIEEYKVLSYESALCPKCGSTLHTVVGSRIRKLYSIEGNKKDYRIRRLYCTSCRKIHHELPDVIVPYKSYDVSSIYNIIIGNKKEVGCDEKTAINVLLWWDRINKYGQSIKSMVEFKSFLKNRPDVPKS